MEQGANSGGLFVQVLRSTIRETMMTTLLRNHLRRLGGPRNLSMPDDESAATRELRAMMQGRVVSRGDDDYPRARTLSDLPSPRGLPLLGNALQFDLPRLHLVLEEWAEKFGLCLR